MKYQKVGKTTPPIHIRDFLLLPLLLLLLLLSLLETIRNGVTGDWRRTRRCCMHREFLEKFQYLGESEVVLDVYLIWIWKIYLCFNFNFKKVEQENQLGMKRRQKTTAKKERQSLMILLKFLYFSFLMLKCRSSNRIDYSILKTILIAISNNN